jgi:hypothetical protein
MKKIRPVNRLEIITAYELIDTCSETCRHTKAAFQDSGGGGGGPRERISPFKYETLYFNASVLSRWVSNTYTH